MKNIKQFKTHLIIAHFTFLQMTDKKISTEIKFEEFFEIK